MSEACSIKELLACFLARDLNDGEELQVGVALPIPEAAVRLAHLMHGPNMELIFLGARMNVHHLNRFDQVKDWHRRVFFIGGIQIDAYGNANLIGIGDNHRRLRFRGPGSVGTPTLTTHVGRYYIVLNNHDKRVLVPHCDFVSAVGWDKGGADARLKLGLPGGGPKYCVTPLCIMDFDEVDKHMRLRSVHPGVSVDDVIANTGFPLRIPAQVPVTQAPSAAELQVLRERVDWVGALR
jgi:glutaconate CoA-transferase subunit B